MNKRESKVYKETLLAIRARLRGDFSGLADAALRKTRSESSGDLSSMPIHMADIGTDAFEQEFKLSLMEHDGTAWSRLKVLLSELGGHLWCLHRMRAENPQDPPECPPLHPLLRQVRGQSPQPLRGDRRRQLR